MGLFRRQKDLLSKQREELGLDRPPDSPRPTHSGPPADLPSTDAPQILGPDRDSPEVGFPGFEGARFDPQHSYEGGFTISSDLPSTGWRRIITPPRVFFVTLAVVWWALHRLGLASSAALIAAFTLAVMAAARLGRSRIRIQTTRGAPRSAPWQDPAEPPPDPGEQPQA